MPKLLARLLGQQNVLTVSRELIVALDHDIPAALLCSQLVYWTDRTEDPEGWIWKTYPQWHDELALTEYQVRRATDRLRKLGLVETKLAKVNGAPTLHYRFDLAEFSEWILEFLQNPTPTNSRNQSAETSGSLTPETTAETKQRETGPSPRVMQLWAATIDGVRLPQGLAGDVHLLQPVSWSDGRLVLAAPTATVARRWEKRAGELVQVLAAAAPVALAELAVVTG